jgi:glycosyltransferase involved in cell wall biosynthesis
LKILEVNTEKTWRGGERQTFFALKGFVLLNQTVELVARKGFPLHTKSEEEGIKCYPVKSHLAVIPFFILSGHKYDIIHVQTASLLTFAVLTKPFHVAKVVFTRRLDFVPKGWLTRWKYRQADLIVSITTPIKNILSKFGVEKQVVIPECIEEKELNFSRAKEVIIELQLTGKKIIGTTAALVQHKDPQTLVKTIDALSKLRNDFVLLHFGEGILQPEIERMISDRNLGNYYKLMGFQQNVEDFFSIFDVFVMSSEEEGLGSSVLDAFIYNVPVVSTNAGGLAEILDGRGNLVNVKDFQALAEQLNIVLANPESTAITVNKAFQYANKALTVENVHKMYLDAFEKLIH